ncbi:MAG: 2-amino-4-hydroxy-6-hydroxymethyldihydropteridine diphosphokinase [Gammaproteobacteria bacterium]|nr:2-amino-4-hydroxy-6-hydroxymethyldihydropteridine diphosphokinase [Gammaproteobacteria bacterium]
MTTVFVGLGSNLNNPVRQITQACDDIAALAHVTLVKISSLYRSPPMGPQNQPEYVNAVVEIATTLSPETLLLELNAIENRHDRARGAERWSARTLDLDILLYGDKLIKTENLTIPHLGLYERAFVLYPLLEIAPDLQIPGHGPLRELAHTIDAGGLEKIGTFSSFNNNGF